MALERGTWLQLQHSRCQLQCDWSLFCQPFLGEHEERQMFFSPITCYKVCLLRVSRFCLCLVFLMWSISCWRWKVCASADPGSRIPDVDPFMPTEELSLFYSTTCQYMTHLYWHHQEQCLQGLDALLITSWILTEVFKVPFTVFDKCGALLCI